MSCGPVVSDRKAAYNRRMAREIVSRIIRRQQPRRFHYPLGKDGNDGVLVLPYPVTRVNDEERFDNGDTPVKGGLLLI